MQNIIPAAHFIYGVKRKNISALGFCNRALAPIPVKSSIGVARNRGECIVCIPPQLVSFPEVA